MTDRIRDDLGEESFNVRLQTDADRASIVGVTNEDVAIFKRLPNSKINNAGLAKTLTGETWQNISNKTGISVAELMAANPGMGVPSGKVLSRSF